jgi:hypothetical protein
MPGADQILAFLFRSFGYVMFGFFLEVFYAVTGIEKSVGAPIPRRVPKKYLEGFVSLYMIPIHGLGMYFGFEAVQALIGDWNIVFRFIIWAITITLMEALGGFLYQKTIGFYSWDYYRLSPYKVFKDGYTLWTLLPQWGLAGLLMEQYSLLLQYLTPYALAYFNS